MATPSRHNVDPRQIIAELAAKHSDRSFTVRPPATGPMQVYDPRQVAQARQYVGWKSHEPYDNPDDPAPDAAERAARILACDRKSPLNRRVWGLDEEDPAGAADFSEVTKSFDEWAENIHAGTVPQDPPSGRHEPQDGADVP